MFKTSLEERDHNMVNVNNYFLGINNSNPADFVVSNSDKCVLRLNSNYFVGVDNNKPSHFVIENSEGKTLLKLGSNFFIGEDGSSPPKFVILNAVGENILESDSKKTNAERPYFNAYLSKFIPLPPTPNNVITFIFDKIISNTGGHYNPNTGNFTAPVSGLYQFDCTVYAHPKYDKRISLTVGNITYSKSTPSINSGTIGMSYSISWSGIMEAMQTVFCSFQMRSSTTQPGIDVYGSEAVPHTRFSGYLLDV